MFADENEFRKAVAGMPIDDGPRRTHQEELRRRVLRTFDETAAGEPLSEETGRHSWPRRRIMRHRIVQIGVALAAACLVVAFVWPFGPGAGVAFAKVQEIVAEVRTVCFDMVESHDGQSEGLAKVMFMEPGRMRAEWQGIIGVMDWNAGKFMTLSAEDKVAHLVEVTDAENPCQRNWLAALKSIVGCKSAKEMGQKQVGGREAKGWEVPDQDGVCTVWADARTGELLQAEFTRGRNKCVMSNFVVNPELDPALFAMTPPAGYTLETNLKVTEADASEANIIFLLRVWASGNGGQFPDRLNPAKFGMAATKADWHGLGVDSDEKSMAARKSIGQAMYRLHGGKLEWGYLGAGAKVGEKDRPVFWSRAAGAQNYRVVHADFTVAEVSAEKFTELVPENPTTPEP